MTKTKRKRWGKKRTFVRNWKEYNEELVRRGTFYLDLDWVKNWKRELAEMNKNKVGRPFEFPESLSNCRQFGSSLLITEAWKELLKQCMSLADFQRTTISAR